jgi:hypothetical protein
VHYVGYCTVPYQLSVMITALSVHQRTHIVADNFRKLPLWHHKEILIKKTRQIQANYNLTCLNVDAISLHAWRNLSPRPVFRRNEWRNDFSTAGTSCITFWLPWPSLVPVKNFNQRLSGCSGVPRNFFRGGFTAGFFFRGVQQIQLRKEGRENGIWGR